MKVSELIEKLRQYDGEAEVVGIYTESGGCCCRSYEETIEKFVYEVADGTYRDTEYTKGPRGGKHAWRPVTKPAVKLFLEY